MPFIPQHPITGKTFHALILIDDGLSVFVQIDDPHGAHGMAVATTDTLRFINLHADFLLPFSPYLTQLLLGDKCKIVSKIGNLLRRVKKGSPLLF
jgi:hypothetical protein